MVAGIPGRVEDASPESCAAHRRVLWISSAQRKWMPGSVLRYAPDHEETFPKRTDSNDEKSSLNIALEREKDVSPGRLFLFLRPASA